MAKKVLIVEDEEGWRQAFEEWIRAFAVADIKTASSVKEFENIWVRDQEFDLIIMDSCLGGDEIDTLDLITRIRATHNKDILAVSGSTPYLLYMENAGCNHQSTKYGAEKKLREILAPDGS